MPGYTHHHLSPPAFVQPASHKQHNYPMAEQCLLGQQSTPQHRLPPCTHHS